MTEISAKQMEDNEMERYLMWGNIRFKEKELNAREGVIETTEKAQWPRPKPNWRHRDGLSKQIINQTINSKNLVPIHF